MRNAKAEEPPFLAPPAEVFLRLGYVFDKLERPAESLPALQTAAALRPFDANILKSLAIAHLNRGDAASAERFFIRALKLSPLDFEAMSLLDQAKSGRLRIVTAEGRFGSGPLARLLSCERTARVFSMFFAMIRKTSPKR